MNRGLLSKVFILAILIILTAAACGGSEPTEAPGETVQVGGGEGPAETESPESTEPPEPTEAESGEESVSGAISSRQEAQGGVIQIEAQGTFADPEFGQVSSAGRGSGFIIDPSGIAVTNNHVVTGAALLKVWIGGDTTNTYNARILGVSECSDLAVIQIEGEDFAYFDWYTGDIEVGTEVYSLGFPLGETEYTLTRGVISKASAPGETNWASLDSVIGHDATINPGNSGGPLINNDGQVVGVNYRSRPDFDQHFAIGAEMAIPIVEELQSGQDVDAIGVNGEAVVSNDGSLSGIWVASVESGSPADEAGIIGGDIIISLEGLALATDGTMADYCDIIRSHSPDDTLSIEVIRTTTQEVMEGQLNGRELVATDSYGEGTGEEVVETESETGLLYSEYMTVTDDREAIVMDIPAEWSDMDGSIWESSWGNVDFVASSLQAAADIDALNNSWLEPGVWLAASEDWGRLGGYAQLLDGVRGWYEDECELDGVYDYGAEDPLYEGKYDLWVDCGDQDTWVYVLAVRPKADPTAYLVLLQVQIVTDADLDALEKILDSFEVIGNLP